MALQGENVKCKMMRFCTCSFPQKLMTFNVTFVLHMAQSITEKKLTEIIVMLPLSLLPHLPHSNRVPIMYKRAF
jgi:hypothetical protein